MTQGIWIGERMNRKKREMLFGYLFLAPALACLITFIFVPIFWAVELSLYDYNVISQKEFIGIGNFTKMISDAKWANSLDKTWKYVVLFVPSIFLISLALALIIKHITKLSGFFRTSFFLPIIVSSTAAGAIFKMVFNRNAGFLNAFIRLMGGSNLNWLGDPSRALICCVILAVWLGMGYNMIVFLAGLQDIPKDYYEAASIDGATSWQQFLHITFPGLAQTSIFILTMSIINAFQAFDGIKMLTNGGPNDMTQLAVLRIYENAFIHFQMGYSCAQSLVLFGIILVITAIQLKATSSLADH
ncbi:MAG: carbohydrate ABC transporter permease [Christensenellales bacterium]|jgi:multiple sugar transport system permease protein